MTINRYLGALLVLAGGCLIWASRTGVGADSTSQTTVNLAFMLLVAGIVFLALGVAVLSFAVKVK